MFLFKVTNLRVLKNRILVYRSLLSSFSSTSSTSPKLSPSTSLSSSSTVLFSSSPPLVILNAARAFFLQGLVSFYLSLKLGEKALHLKGFHYDTTKSVAELYDTLQSALFDTINPSLSPHAQGSIALLFASICCINFAKGIVERTVLRIERLDKEQQEKGQEDILRITRMSLFPSHNSLGTSLLFNRKDVRGAESHRVTTMFRVKKQGWIGSEMDQYLFPVEGEGGRVDAKGAWKSDDLKYLQELIYSDYFRKNEQSPTYDRLLIDIDGFGPYRPAQLADPNHPAFTIGEELALKKIELQMKTKVVKEGHSMSNGSLEKSDAYVSSEVPLNASSNTEDSRIKNEIGQVVINRIELKEALIKQTNSSKSDWILPNNNNDTVTTSTPYIVDRNGNLYSQFINPTKPSLEELRSIELNREMIKGKKITLEEQREVILPNKFVSSIR